MCVFVSRRICMCVTPPLLLFFFCDRVSHGPRTGKISETGCPGSLRPGETVSTIFVLRVQVCRIKPTAFYFILYSVYGRFACIYVCAPHA